MSSKILTCCAGTPVVCSSDQQRDCRPGCPYQLQHVLCALCGFGLRLSAMELRQPRLCFRSHPALGRCLALGGIGHFNTKQHRLPVVGPCQPLYGPDSEKLSITGDSRNVATCTGKASNISNIAIPQTSSEAEVTAEWSIRTVGSHQPSSFGWQGCVLQSCMLVHMTRRQGELSHREKSPVQSRS